MTQELTRLAQATQPPADPAGLPAEGADAVPAPPANEGMTVENLGDLIGQSLAFFQGWLNQIGITSTYTGFQWAAIQFAVIVAGFAVALVLDRLVTPKLETQARKKPD